MARVKKHDEFIIRNADDLQQLFERLIDERDDTVYTKPKILSKREKAGGLLS